MSDAIFVPAIRARMGSTEYYQAVLRADELASHVHAAMDFPEFKSFMESEKMQRPMSEGRVEEEIVPYLCTHPDRFFGSVIVLAYEPDLFEFTSWSDQGFQGGVAAVRDNAQRAGILEISGGRLFALDGQHRLHALRVVIGDEDVTPRKKLPIGGEFRDDVAEDELSVIFLNFESTEKARRIFNKVNRYAKPTSESTNILTSEDDGYAIITRCLIGVDDPDKFGGVSRPPLDIHLPAALGRPDRAIEFEKKSLETNSPSFTTLHLVYLSVQAICLATGHPSLSEKDTIRRPDDTTLAAAYEVCAEWWDTLMSSFKPFAAVAKNPMYAQGARHMDEPFSLAFRPKSQEALIRAIADAHTLTGLPIDVLVDRANAVPLRLGSPTWLGVLVGSNGKMITKHARIAQELMTFCLVGDAIGPRRLDALETNYRAAKRDGGYSARPLPKLKF